MDSSRNLSDGDDSDFEIRCCDLKIGKNVSKTFEILKKHYDFIGLQHEILHNYLINAARNKHFDCFDWIDRNGRDVVSEHFSLSKLPSNTQSFIASHEAKDILIVAAHSKCLTFLKFAEKVGALLDDEIWETAATAGDLGVLEFASSRMDFEHFSQNVLIAAAKGGHLKILKFASKLKTQTFSPDVWISAAEFGHCNILQYANSRGVDLKQEAWHMAAEKGHLRIIRFALKKKIRVDQKVWAIIAKKKKNFTFLLFAHENKIELDESVWNSAAEAGCLEIVKFGHEMGYLNRYDGTMCREKVTLLLKSAAKNEHVRIMTYIMDSIECEKEFESKKVFDDVWLYAAEIGKTQVLKCFYERGFIFKHDVWMAALRKKHFDILQLAVDKNIKIPDVWKEAKENFVFGALLIGVKHAKVRLSQKVLMKAAEDNSVDGTELLKYMIQIKRGNLPGEILDLANHDVLMEYISCNNFFPIDLLKNIDFGYIIEKYGYFLFRDALEKKIAIPEDVFFYAAADKQGWAFLKFAFHNKKIPNSIFDKAIDARFGEDFLAFALEKMNYQFGFGFGQFWSRIAEKEGTLRSRFFKIVSERKILLPQHIIPKLVKSKAFDVLLIALNTDVSFLLPPDAFEEATAWCRCGPCLKNSYRKQKHDATEFLNVAFDKGIAFHQRVWMNLSFNGCTLISRAIERKIPFNLAVLASIAANGDEAVLKLALENGYNLNVPDIWTKVSRGDREENLIFPIVNQFKIDEHVWILAAERGYFEILELAFKNGFTFGPLTWLGAAIGLDGFKTLMLGIDAHVDFEERVWLQAVITDTKAVVFKRAHKMGYKFEDFGENVWKKAIQERNFAVLGFAIANGFKLSNDTLVEIVEKDEFDIVNFLLRKNIEFDESLLIEIVHRGGFYVFRKALKKHVTFRDHVWIALANNHFAIKMRFDIKPNKRQFTMNGFSVIKMAIKRNIVLCDTVWSIIQQKKRFDLVDMAIARGIRFRPKPSIMQEH